MKGCIELRAGNIEVKLTIPFPVSRPDMNGVIYSKESIEKAVSTLRKGLPIIYRDNNSNTDSVVVGCTIGDSHIVTWDRDNGVCKITVDGVIRYGGTECVVKSSEGNVVKDFEIVGFGISL